MRKTSPISSLLLWVWVLGVLWPAGSVLSQEREPQPVAVTNFPEVFKTEGKTAVEGTIHHSTLVKKLGVVVPPGVAREKASQLIDGGIVTSAGFTAILLSLQGELRGTLGEAGMVGAVLVPAEKPILDVLEEKGQIHFPLEVSASLARPEVELFTAQSHLAVAFPRYRIYFYNSTDKSVAVDLFVYLTN